MQSRIAKLNSKLNKFDLTHDHKTTANMGYLFPVSCFEVLPNDWFNIRNEFLVRFMATIAPVMHLFKVSLHWWYMPTRLGFEKFPQFITGGPDGQDDTVAPYMVTPEGGVEYGSLANRLGVPAKVGGLKYSAIPTRMYNLIWNENYRNQSVQDPVPVSLADGLDETTNTELLKRNWERDYFTNALPSPQRGPEVFVPLGDKAVVVGDGSSLKLYDGVTEGVLSHVNNSPDALVYNANTGAVPVGTDPFSNPEYGIGTVNLKNGTLGVTPNSPSGLVADLSTASAITLNAFRMASAVQQVGEASILDGNRYAEWLPSMWNVVSPNAELQRPQWLGGCSAPLVISEVLQTSATDSESPQGNMAGHGISAGETPTIKFHSREYGYVMCLMSIMPKTGYYQGLPRHFSRETRWDYALPILAHIGMQGIKNKEIYATGQEGDDDVFAYTPRFDEYRTIPSQVSGQFADTLKFWTAVRSFGERPEFNENFVSSTPTTDIFAVESNTEGEEVDHLRVQVMHHVKALRPLPKHGDPGMHII